MCQNFTQTLTLPDHVQDNRGFYQPLCQPMMIILTEI